MARYIYIIGLILIFNTPNLAQKDTLESDYFSIENLPEFTFGAGLGIMPRDSSFLINFRFRMQNRISFDADGKGITRVEARIRRLRLRFDGFILDPRITYALQLSFAPEDIMDYMADSPPNLIRDAIVYFSPNRHWTLGFGQTKLPGNRERINSSGDLQLADRSPANSIFNIDRDFGIQVVYRNDSENKPSYSIKSALTTGEGRNWVSTPGTGFSYTTRLELLPTGTFHRRGDFFQGDLVRENKPKIAFGLVYNFNDDALREAGQRGDRLYDTRDIRNIIADLILKYRGLAVMAEVMDRYSKEPVTVNPVNPIDIVYIFSGRGGTFQGSYLFRNNIELVGRYSTIVSDETISDYSLNEGGYYTIGINKYFRGHLLKIQADATYNQEEFPGTDRLEEYLNFRFQVELGI
jgi:hypothetical protein